MKKTVGLIVVAAVCVTMIIAGYYYYTTQKGGSAKSAGDLTEVQKVITKNLDRDYPKTPREVVKFYSRILSCFYNADCTDEEIGALGDQARRLFDAELLENNPREQYLSALKADIADYREKSKVITGTSVCGSSEVVERTVDGYRCAYVEAVYYINENKAPLQANQTYVLRKDEDGNWKILVFYKTEGESSDD